MNSTNLIGQTLDEKYQIERELGRGGMGTVYLATHLGTERPVAIKVISPQYMTRPEFVERFRREARAAGRLRHPNVVDVTDFGFSQIADGQVAYLVMEYLDGCTLGEILEEEKNLPVSWTLDILEQVCSAVHEAHEQGIIHRDLKPDNIWLEPNQRGGYTVKVLDFGIAKLETHDGGQLEFEPRDPSVPTMAATPNATAADLSNASTILEDGPSTTIIDSPAMVRSLEKPVANGDSETLIQAVDGIEEPRTFVLKTGRAGGRDQESVKTRVLSTDESINADGRPTPQNSLRYTSAAADLTRVGSVLGTPLYMSPEQCRGDHLDARSDIYSLGIIAYQMLSGDTPFKGDFTRVMESHKFVSPPPLEAKKVRKKLKGVIRTALAKDPDDRPQTAEAFSSSLRARSEGIFGLLRRAGMIYTEHIQKFLMLSAFFHLPAIVLSAILMTLSFLKVSEVISSGTANIAIWTIGALYSVITAFCVYLIIGTITWIVTQSLAVPLRPIRLRSALKEARLKWKSFAGTGVISTVLSLVIGVVTCGIGFLVTSVLWALVAPVVMMEGLKGRHALKRSKDLVKRSLATAAAAVLIMFIIPAVSAGAMSLMVSMTAKALRIQHSDIKRGADVIAEGQKTGPSAESEREVNFSVGRGQGIRFESTNKDMRSRLTDTILETLLQIFLLPIQIIVTSFTAIIVALLYLKTRQAGGEPLQELLARFEDTDKPRKKWQERVRQRLIQSGRITGRT